MFFLNVKSKRFLLSCLVLFACLTTALAQKTPSQDAVEDALDFNALLAAIKHHDALLKSGEGEIVYTLGAASFDTDTDTEIVTGRIAFDSENTLFDAEKTPFYPRGKTTFLIPTGMWEITRNRKGESRYYFKPERYFSRELKSIRPLHDVDPRRWITLRRKNLAIYLEGKNFRITGHEVFNDILCYVLEAKDGDRAEKIWIAPERGFQYLKHEIQSSRPVDALDSDIPMEAPTITRTTISYQRYGEVWFPKAVFDEYAWLDFKPEDPIISRQRLELKNFKINHDIPPETFTVDIPDDAMIKVTRISEKLSKQEFLKRYGQQTDN